MHSGHGKDNDIENEYFEATSKTLAEMYSYCIPTKLVI